MILYNANIKRVLVGFASLFNNITIQRLLDNGQVKHIGVPINFAPAEKEYLSIVENNNLREVKPGITYPRLSYQIVADEVDNSRLLNRFLRFRGCTPDSNGDMPLIRPFMPINLTIELYLYTDILDDAYQVKERIMTGFRPAVYMLINQEYSIVSRIPVELESMSREDTYEGKLSETRIIMHKFTFKVKAEFYSFNSQENADLIKKITLPFQYITTGDTIETVKIRVEPESANPNDVYTVVREII